MYPDYGYYGTSYYFDGATRSRTITIHIRNDMVVENQFELFYIYLWNYYSDSAVMLDPATAIVTIEDDDSELSLHSAKGLHVKWYDNLFNSSTSVVTIGFNGTYSVREGAGGISIVVLVLMNSLARDVVVTLSTQDVTAQGVFVVMVPN